MKTSTSSAHPTVSDIATKVREAITRSNTLLLEQRKNPRRDRLEVSAATQQMRGVLVGELSSINVFPEDAYETLYRYSIENEDETTYMEELLFLEHCIR